MREAITIAIAGDVMLGRGVNRIIPERGFEYPWGNLLPILKDSDLFLINLECALTSRTEPWRDDLHKPFHFRAEPSVVRTLRAAGVNFACIANNHICDFSTEGLLDTIRVLDSANIAHAGAGANLAAARAPARLKAKGQRIAVVAAADYPRMWAAAPQSPGMNYTEVSVDGDDFRPIAEALLDSRRGADLVIFCIHWGPNMRLRPPPDFRAFARAVIDAGADVFWGHSAHVVQGIEIWKGKLILYDTGDFVDDYAVDPELRNDLSALFLLHVRPPLVEEVEVVPVSIDDMQVSLAHHLERDFLLDRLVRLSAEMGTEVIRERKTARIAVAAPVEEASGWTSP